MQLKKQKSTTNNGVVMKNLKLSFTLATFLVMAIGNLTFAHCDSVNGPVVKASVKALETGNINYVLIWVRAEDEKEIKGMFEKVNKVRALSPDTKELVDMYFFETVVRVHRMGEGVGYTGLKSEEYVPEEGIEAADIAVEKDTVESILSMLDEKYHSKVNDMFADIQSKKNYDVNDLKAGREYVESYVHFIHYVEEFYNGKENKIEEMHNH